MLYSRENNYVITFLTSYEWNSYTSNINMQSDIYILKLNWYTTVVIQRARHFLLKLQHFSWFSSEFLFPNISISKLLNFNRVSILFEKKKIYLRTDGSVCSILSIKLQKGQVIFSHPHCRVDEFGALSTLMVGWFVWKQKKKIFIQYWWKL